MRRSLRLLIVILFGLLLYGCSDKTTGGNEPVALEFVTTPSGELTQIVENSPSDFTWSNINSTLELQMNAEPDWSGSIVLSAFQLQNGEVVNRASSDPLETGAEELSSGVKVAELVSESDWLNGQEWVPSTKWIPSGLWVPSTKWTPSEIEDMALTEADLASNQTMVVVYVTLSGDTPDREQTVQPLGLVFQERQPTEGTLEIITTTSGEDLDTDGYELTVDGGSAMSVDTADTAHVENLSEGSHNVELTGMAENCSLSGNNPRTVNITAGDTTSTTFDVQCEAKPTIVEHFARSSGSVQVVNARPLQVRPGKLDFLQQNDIYLGESPDNLMLIIPEEASADGQIQLSEMIGILPVSSEKQPVNLKEAWPGSMWCFHGQDFFPGVEWTSFPGSKWMPEKLNGFEVAFINGDHEISELFGDVDISAYKEPNDEPLETSGEQKLAIAAPADVLFNLDVEITKDLSEVLHQPAENLDIISGSQDKGGILLPMNLQPGSEIGNKAIFTVAGKQFFSGSAWSPENVSAFSGPVPEIFATGNNPFLEGSQWLLFGGDRFGSAPERFSLIEPGQTIENLESYQVMVAGSVLNIDLGLYPAANSSLQLSTFTTLQSGDTGTYFPESFYHPVDFTFPEQFHIPEVRFARMPLETGYNASAMSEFGTTVTIN